MNWQKMWWRWDNSKLFTNRDATNYLKGVAISTVMLGHFSSRFMTLPFDFYANYFIAFFFLLSGYGNFYSLSSGTGRNALEVKKSADFVFKRLLRIYPLFWTNIALDYIFDPNIVIGDDSWADILLLQFTDPHRLWFLNAIIPCYFLAPFAYYAVARSGRLFPYFLVVILLLLNCLAALVGVPHVRCWMYQFIYFGEFFLFAFGMYIASLFHEGDGKVFLDSCSCFCKSCLKSKMFLLVGFVLIIILAVKTASLQIMAGASPRQQILPKDWHYMYPAIFYGVIIVFTLSFLQQKSWPLLGKIFCLLGVYSFPLYVFGGMFNTALERFGLVHGQATSNIIVYLLIFPFFLVFCMVMQKIYNSPRLFIKQFSERISWWK